MPCSARGTERYSERVHIAEILAEAKKKPGNEKKSDEDLLKQIDKGGIKIKHHGGSKEGQNRPCCPNCKQILSNLGIPPGDPRFGS